MSSKGRKGGKEPFFHVLLCPFAEKGEAKGKDKNEKGSLSLSALCLIEKMEEAEEEEGLYQGYQTEGGRRRRLKMVLGKEGESECSHGLPLPLEARERGGGFLAFGRQQQKRGSSLLLLLFSQKSSSSFSSI